MSEEDNPKKNDKPVIRIKIGNTWMSIDDLNKRYPKPHLSDLLPKYDLSDRAILGRSVPNLNELKNLEILGSALLNLNELKSRAFLGGNLNSITDRALLGSVEANLNELNSRAILGSTVPNLNELTNRAILGSTVANIPDLSVRAIHGSTVSLSEIIRTHDVERENHYRRVEQIQAGVSPIMPIFEIVLLWSPDFWDREERNKKARSILKLYMRGWIRFARLPQQIPIGGEHYFDALPFDKQVQSYLHVDEFEHVALDGLLDSSAVEFAAWWRSKVSRNNKPQTILLEHDTNLQESLLEHAKRAIENEEKRKAGSAKGGSAKTAEQQANYATHKEWWDKWQRGEIFYKNVTAYDQAMVDKTGVTHKTAIRHRQEFEKVEKLRS